MRNSALACVVGLAGLFGAGTISTPAEAQTLACGGTYTIQRGDTLWDISQAHQVSVRQLAAWNNMAPRDYLKPGQQLVIWKRKDHRTDIEQLSLSPAINALTQKINYRVRNGDSLARISQRFNVSVQDLLAWNPNTRGRKYIQPGEMLIVYVDVTQVSENS